MVLRRGAHWMSNFWWCRVWILIDLGGTRLVSSRATGSFVCPRHGRNSWYKVNEKNVMISQQDVVISAMDSGGDRQ
jgi:hypothetical protein